MNLAKLRELAAHHSAEALQMDTRAAMHTELFSDTPAAEITREKAAWHRRTASELRELADAFSTISSLLIQP